MWYIIGMLNKTKSYETVSLGTNCHSIHVPAGHLFPSNGQRILSVDKNYLDIHIDESKISKPSKDKEPDPRSRGTGMGFFKIFE